MFACASPLAPDANGQWGSSQADLVLTRTGGTLTLQCGSGTIDSTWQLSAAGDFTGTGMTFGGGGPDPIGGRVPQPSRYTGHIAGSTFILSVVVIQSNATLGPYRMRRGGPAAGPVCL
ncbi:MAG: hypothetical protein H7099_06055 [Gemmatimonadaceae bacterium]|nr:hypothetical protein [Gemmatimonadaceae bacterium]